MVEKESSLSRDDDNPVKHRVVSRGITDRELTQDELCEINEELQQLVDELIGKQALPFSEDQFRAIADNIPDLTIIFDIRGVCTYVSPSLERITGRNADEFVGRKICDIEAALGIDPDGTEMIMTCGKTAMQRPGVFIPVPPLRGHDRDGSTIHVEGTVTYLPHETGIQGIVFHGHDITDKKRVEETLRERADKYRHLVEDSTDWIWEIDLEGITTYSNPAVYDLLGYQVSEIVGTNTFSFIHPDDKQRISEMLAEWSDPDKEVKRDGTGYTFTIRFLHKNGSTRTFESSVTPVLNADGKLIGFRGIDRDITDRKQAQEALPRAEK